MKLLIAIPTMDSVPVEFVKSLTDLVRHLTEDGVDFSVKIETGTLVYFAREHLAKYAINNQFTHVLWLDSDMVFSSEIVEDLQFSGKKFVTGIAHSRRPPYSSCLFTEIFPAIEKRKGNNYPTDTFEVAACGMACVLMSVEVLQKVFDRFGWMFLPTDIYGEDVAFCWRAGQCGYKIYAEPSVRVGHVGKVTIYPEDYKGDYHD